MKFVIAQMKHETHSFVPRTTALKDFYTSGGDMSVEGDEAITTLRRGNNAVAAYIDLAESIGAEYVVPIAREALPSGPTEDVAFEYMSDKIIKAVESGCDAVMLDLHGSMVTETFVDGEGELLQRIRNASPGIPIAVALDFHCSVTSKMIDNVTVMTMYRTTPHIDIYETGQRAAKTLLGFLRGENQPLICAKRLPLMASLEKMNQTSSPMKEVIDLIREIEENDNEILNASISGGHPFTDVSPGGMVAVIVADGKRESGNAAAEKILRLAWENRDGFVYEVEPFSKTLKAARELAEGPIIMADSGDIPTSGGFGADVTVLKEVIAQGFEDIAVGPIYDPESVRQMIEAGVGSEITLNLGGKIDVPLLNYWGESVQITGRVRAIVDGRFQMTGPIAPGMWLSIGLMAVLSTETMEILITENRFEALDTSIFKHVGIDPLEKKYLLIKSRQHFRAAFEPIANHIVQIAGPGVTNPDFSDFPFKHIARPVFPLDRDVALKFDTLGSI